MANKETGLYWDEKDHPRVELTAAKARELAKSVKGGKTATQVANAIADIKKAVKQGLFRISISETLTGDAKETLLALGYQIYSGNGYTEVSW